MADWRQGVWDKFAEMENTMHTSGIINTDHRRGVRNDVAMILDSKMNTYDITSDSDAFEEIKIAYDEALEGKWGVASLGDHTKYNLLYNKPLMEKNGIPHERVSLGAHWLGTSFDHKKLTMGIQSGHVSTMNEIKNELMDQSVINMRRRNMLDASIGGDVDPDKTSTKLDEDLTRGLGLPETPTQVIGENANANLAVNLNQEVITEEQMMRQQTLDDIMAGNAENMYTSLIQRSGGEKGYYIAVFNKPVGSSPKFHELVGIMNNPNGSQHVVTEEELVGASASNQILEYLQSWHFNYGHKSVEILYKEGKDGKVVPGPGRAVPGFDLGTGIEEYGSGWFGPARRAFSFMTSEMGELEFKHAVEPLYLMLQAKAKELNVDYLDREQSQDVLRSFSDRFNRSFSENLEHEPLSYFKGAARWVANFWEYDANLREGSSDYLSKETQQKNQDLFPFIGKE